MTVLRQSTLHVTQQVHWGAGSKVAAGIRYHA